MLSIKDLVSLVEKFKEEFGELPYWVSPWGRAINQIFIDNKQALLKVYLIESPSERNLLEYIYNELDSLKWRAIDGGDNKILLAKLDKDYLIEIEIK